MSLILLLTGCYSYTPISKDIPPLGTDIVIRLTNGTQIVPSEYQRVENGYQVVGEWNSVLFNGFVPDNNISDIIVKKFDSVMTVVVVGVMVVLPIVLYFSLTEFKFSMEKQ